MKTVEQQDATRYEVDHRTGLIMQEPISIPEDDAEFLRTYARRHDISVQKLIHEWVKQLKDPNDSSVHPSLKTVTGTVPGDVDVREEYYAHQIEKHSK